jgi:hypothetical protein
MDHSQGEERAGERTEEFVRIVVDIPDPDMGVTGRKLRLIGLSITSTS